MTMPPDEYSLKELLCLPLKKRACIIFEFGKDDLLAAVREHRKRTGLDVITPERLAWAVAFNLKQYRDRFCELRGRRSDLDPTLKELWSALTEPDENSSTVLTRLADSVVCEQKEDQDWQNGPISSDKAKQAVRYFYEANEPKIIGSIQQCFGFRAEDAEEINHEAWERVLSDNWCPKAKRRLLGLCSISTYVCKVAHNAAIDRIKERVRERQLVSAQALPISTDDNRFTHDDPLNLIRTDLGGNPTGNLFLEELRRDIHKALAELPKEQRRVAELKLQPILDGKLCLSNKQIAKLLGKTEPAVSQLWTKARYSLLNSLCDKGYVRARNCLSEKGKEVGEERRRPRNIQRPQPPIG